jgi:hypothetical protein
MQPLQWLQQATAVPIVVGGCIVGLAYRRAASQHRAKVSLPPGHGMIRVMLFLEVPLGIFTALKLWMPVLIQYCVDYAMTTTSLFCAGLYVRCLLMAVYKGVLRQPVPCFLNFRAVLMMAVIVLLVIMAIVVVAVATKSMWLTAFALFLQSACAVAILVLGSAAYTFLWKAAAQSARESKSSVHPMRKSLKKFLPGVVLCTCSGAFLALLAVPRLSAQGPVPRDSGDLTSTTMVLLVVFAFLVWLTWIPKPASLPSATESRASRSKSKSKSSKVAPLPGSPLNV